jgi:glycosyltransferase involved in cell wall biosynthesis
MKVIHMLDHLNKGGIEMLMLDVCENARNHDLEIILIITGEGELKERFLSSNVKIYDIPRKRSFDLNLIREIRRIISDEKPVAIHAHQAVEGLHAYFAAVNKNVRFILSHHGHLPSRKDDMVLKFLIPRAYINLFVSYGYKKRFENLFKPVKNSYILYNGIDLNNFFIETEKEFGIDRGYGLSMGMVGNFVPGKDQKTICCSLKLLLEKKTDFKFTFIGNPAKDKPELYSDCINFCNQNSLNDNVIFLRNVTSVKKAISDFDLFVFSTIEDTFGISVIEAMLAGIPVICSDIDPMKEITDNGKYGLLFKSGDPVDLNEKIISLGDNLQLRKKLSAEAKKWAGENFSIDKHIENLKSIYINASTKPGDKRENLN